MFQIIILLGALAVSFVAVLWKSLAKKKQTPVTSESRSAVGDYNYRSATSDSYWNISDSDASISDNGYTRNSANAPKKVVYQPIKIEQPKGLSLTTTLSKLNLHKQAFLNQVEREVQSLIEGSRKRDCVAIIAIRPSGSRVTYRVMDDGWTRRLVAMIKHKDKLSSSNSALPEYDGDQLDSYLSRPIMDKVSELHSQFLRQHGDILGKHMVERLRNNPEVYRKVARHFASNIRDAGKPLTEQLYKALYHLVQQQLSCQSTDELSRQLGDALTHVAGATAITSFSTAMAHAFQGVITKILIKYTSAAALKSAGVVAGKIIGKTVLVSFVSFVASHLAAHGIGVFGALPIYVVLAPIAIAFTAWELNEFPQKLAKKIAPDVRRIMANDFEARNRSALDLIFRDTVKDNAIEIGKMLASESKFAVKAAKEFLKASKECGIQL